MSAITDLNTRINKLFRNPHINFFIIMLLILSITCYTLITTPIKNTISIIISNPIVILFAIIAVVIVGYFDINIAVLLLVLFFIALFGMQYTHSNGNYLNLNTVENFDNAESNSEEEEKHISRIDNNLKIKAQNDKKTDERVNNIKSVVLSTLNKFRNQNDDDYKNAILENKKMMFQSEKQNNNKINKMQLENSNNSSGKDNFKDVISKKNTISSKANGKTGSNKSGSGSGSGSSKSNDNNSNSNRNKEDFQTVKPRTFDPSNEEDTNLLITKEILQDMHNRIEFNYESNKYLKKYIKHRVEEIVDLNKLLDDE